jgi:uncharacterized cupin superfamily protein
VGDPPQERGVARQLMADPGMELDTLEQTISLEQLGIMRQNAHALTPAPIPPAWVIEGDPVARNRRLAGSTDQLSTTYMWDCTAGRFNWHYDEDAIIHVLEGSAMVQDAAGLRQRLQPGDTFLFAAGSSYQWTVYHYIRKIAFLHSPLSPGMRLVRGILKWLTWPLRRKPNDRSVGRYHPETAG